MFACSPRPVLTLTTTSFSSTRKFLHRVTQYQKATSYQGLLGLTVSPKISQKNSYHQESRQNRRTKFGESSTGYVALGLGVAAGLYWTLKEHDKDGGEKSNGLFKSLMHQVPSSFKNFSSVHAKAEVEAGKLKPGLPTYSVKDVAAHSTKENRIWVTFKNGVYDITDYVTQHPGGKKILMAAGKSIEPYWNLYSVHKNDEILGMLEDLRIGNITEVSVEAATDKNDPYRNDPARSPVLIPSSKKPFNAEPPVELLADQYLTPNHLFFVRNHLPVPHPEPMTYTLEVGCGKKLNSIRLLDLKSQFKKKDVTSVVQCAGNRRSEMVKIKAVKGLNWGSAAISNAKWSGVSLNDLMKAQGVDLDKVCEGHIIFEGLDKQPDDNPYGASIPIELARMLKDDIIIAYEMNGADIPKDHGYPLRVIIPGVVGARQVKWLKKIYFSKDESFCHWQRRDYKGFNSSVDWDTVDFDNSVSISQLPVISAICEPSEGTELEEGSDEVSVKGYAWSGGGRGIIRVDVSTDGGKTWHEAKLKPNGQSPYKSWAWTLWEADVPLPPGIQNVQLICKAVDVSYNVQPDSVEGIWNLRGVLSNAWHRINISVPHEKS